MTDPDTDPLADLKSHHPTRINLDALEKRAITAEERAGIINAARSARDNRDLVAFLIRAVPDLLKIII